MIILTSSHLFSPIKRFTFTCSFIIHIYVGDGIQWYYQFLLMLHLHFKQPAFIFNNLHGKYKVMTNKTGCVIGHGLQHLKKNKIMWQCCYPKNKQWKPFKKIYLVVFSEIKHCMSQCRKQNGISAINKRYEVISQNY